MGGPGIGKTVVAVHPGTRIAKQPNGPVLLTTFFWTLSAASQLVDQLLGADRVLANASTW